MRNQTTILLLLLVLCGALWFTHNSPLLSPPQSVAPQPDEQAPAVIRSAITNEMAETEFFKNPVFSVPFSPPSPITSNSPSSTAETGTSNIPFFVEPRPEMFINTAKEQPLPKRIVTEKLPGLLADKEGSYTNLTEPFRGDGTRSFAVRSDWATRYLFPNRALPDLRVRMIKSPETGEYEPVGGTLILPGSSLEAGYEIDPASDEHKATLQWKKSF